LANLAEVAFLLRRKVDVLLAGLGIGLLVRLNVEWVVLAGVEGASAVLGVALRVVIGRHPLVAVLVGMLKRELLGGRRDKAVFVRRRADVLCVLQVLAALAQLRKHKRLSLVLALLQGPLSAHQPNCYKFLLHFIALQSLFFNYYVLVRVRTH
jgi:hypothetical protein